MDVLTSQINQALALWGDREVRVMPSDGDLAAVERWIVSLMETHPPDYQAGRLAVARGRVAQARRVALPGETVCL
jgi:hypothetical protein